MLAAKYNYYNILDYLISKYLPYVNVVNRFNENMLHFLDPSVDKYGDFIIQNKSKLNKLFYSYDVNDVCPLDYLFSNGSYNNIYEINNKVDINYNKYNKTPSYYNLIANKDLSSKDIIKILQLLYKKDKNIFSYVDNESNNILFTIVINNKFKLLLF